MKFLITIAFVVVLASCYYPAPRQSSFGVSGNPSMMSSFEHKLEYHEYEFLVAQETARANAEFRAPDFSGIPGGGYLMVTLKGVTLEMTKPQNHLFVLRDKQDGEIMRKIGRSSVPNYQVLSGFALIEWWDVEAIPLSEPIIDTVYLYVVNTISSASKKFAIYPKPLIRKLP